MNIKNRITFILFFFYFSYNQALLNCEEVGDKQSKIGGRSFNNVEYSKMFSSRIQNNKKSQLLVVKNQDAFIRITGKNSFSYIKPQNMEYELEDNCYVEIEDGKVVMTSNECKNIYESEDNITNVGNDEFYNEGNIECDKMKFDLINDIIINNKKFNGYQMQLYLRDFFNIIKLVLKRNENGKISAFIYTNNNDFGCSPYYEYKIFIDKDDKEDAGMRLKRQNTKKKKIIANSVNEYIDKVSTETYKNMLLSGYTYLKPASFKTDTKKIVLQTKEDEVINIIPMMLNLEWTEIGFNELKSYPSNIDVLQKKEKRKQEQKKNNKNKQQKK